MASTVAAFAAPATRAARSRYWQELFDLPELRSKMTSAMRDEYSSTISHMRDYEFSEFNIRQVLDRIMGQIVTGVEDAILNCFDKLSAEHSYNQTVENGNVHYYNGWKTIRHITSIQNVSSRPTAVLLADIRLTSTGT